MAKSMKQQDGKASIRREVKQGGRSPKVLDSHHSSEAVPAPEVLLEAKEEQATIAVGAGHKLNMGNYESAEIFVSLSLSCDPAKIDDTYPAVKAWVTQRVKAEVEKAKAWRDKVKGNQEGDKTGE